MRCQFTILYITYIADSLMLASCNIRTGRAVFSLAAVNYNATAHSRTLFPVISSVTVPGRRRGVCAGRNRCTGCNDFSTAEALCVAGIAVNLILVVRFTGIYGRCTAYILSTGSAAYHFGNAVDMESDILAKLPADIDAMGNVDPAGVSVWAPPKRCGKPLCR